MIYSRSDSTLMSYAREDSRAVLRKIDDLLVRKQLVVHQQSLLNYEHCTQQSLQNSSVME